MLTASTPKAQVFPNGEFSIGWDSQSRMKRPDKVPPVCDLSLGMLALSKSLGVWLSLLESLKPLLGSSIASNSHRRGLKGIRSKASRMVRNCAFILQRDYGKENLSFATLTIPSMPDRSMRRVLANWSQIVRVFYQSFKRLLKRRSLPEHYCGVVEIQGKRYERTKFIGLHLHFIFVGRLHRQTHWHIKPIELRVLWRKALAPYCGEGVDFTAAENLQAVRRDAGAYLGKYMSKGAKDVQRIAESPDRRYIPRSWYSINLALRRIVRREIYRSAELVPYLIGTRGYTLGHGAVPFIREVTIESQAYGVRVVGYYGRTTVPLDVLRALGDNECIEFIR